MRTKSFYSLNCFIAIGDTAFKDHKFKTFQISTNEFRMFLVGAFYQNEPDYYSGKFFFLFTELLKVLNRRAESHLSYCKGSPLSCTQFLT